MGGEIRADSELGRGSTFSFNARFTVQDVSTHLESVATLNHSNGAAHPACVPTPTSKPLRILVADDSADNRLLISAFLKNTPYKIDEVENGALAVEHFVAHKYDLVLMDIQMPVMDGHAATRAIRDWERDNHRAPTPIVALSAARPVRIVRQQPRRRMRRARNQANPKSRPPRSNRPRHRLTLSYFTGEEAGRIAACR